MLINRNHTVKIIALCTILFLTTHLPISMAGESESPRPPVHYDMQGTPLSAEEAARLQPGLLTVYFHNFFARNVRMLPKRGGKEGKPIFELNNQFGRGKVFDSGTNRGIGIRMNGALHFPTTGKYILQTLSNDGVIIYLSDKLVLSDPTQHSDQLSIESELNVTIAGWYPIRIDYFQRKGTAALKLYWKTPGSDEKVIVPAEAYAHLPATE